MTHMPLWIGLDEDDDLLEDEAPVCPTCHVPMVYLPTRRAWGCIDLDCPDRHQYRIAGDKLVIVLRAEED